MKYPRMPYLSQQEAQELKKALKQGTDLPGGHPLTYGDHSELLAELRAAIGGREPAEEIQMDDDGYTGSSAWVWEGPTGQEWDDMDKEDRLYEAAKAFLAAKERRSATYSGFTPRMNRTLELLVQAVDDLAREPAKRQPRIRATAKRGSR